MVEKLAKKIVQKKERIRTGLGIKSNMCRTKTLEKMRKQNITLTFS